MEKLDVNELDITIGQYLEPLVDKINELIDEAEILEKDIRKIKEEES
jgi:hypothetical protein